MAEQTLENFLVTVESNLATTLAEKAAALPDGFQAAKFQQNCVAMLKGLKKEDLLKVQPADVVSCLMQGALLDLDFASGECYALPYWNKDAKKMDLNFQTDYKGEDKVAKTYSIKPIFNTIKEVVREGDKYQKIVEDGNVKFIFEPLPFNKGNIIGAFAQVMYTDGSCIGEEMSVAELEKLRTDFSKAPNSPAWTKRPGEMYKKTVLRLVLKNVAKSFKNSAQQLAYQTASDFEFSSGVSEGTNESVRNPFITNNQPKQIEVKNENIIPESVINAENTEPDAALLSEAEEYYASIDSEKTAETPVEPYYECAACGVEITSAENEYSKKYYSRPLCRNCQQLAKNGEI